MPQFTIPLDLRALAAEIFGRTPLGRFQIPGVSIDPGEEDDDSPYSATALDKPHSENTHSVLNLPFFAQVSFKETASLTFGPTAQPKIPRAALELTLDDPLVEVTREAVIVSTTVQGRTGQVKEFISDGDYTVTFKGLLTSPPNGLAPSRAYPTSQVRALQELCQEGRVLEVSCFLLQPLGIKNVVVKKLHLTPMAGYVNLQAYELECVSDEAVELNLKPTP